MARSLCKTIMKLTLTPIYKPRPSSSRLLSLRTQSNQPKFPDLADPSTDTEPESDPLLRKLEDAIHRIIVRRSAPDWLPFLPGSSYWVPPPTVKSYGLANLVDKLATPQDSLDSTVAAAGAGAKTAFQGWPSSDYFIKDGAPHPVEVDMTSNTSSKSEDEEG